MPRTSPRPSTDEKLASAEQQLEAELRRLVESGEYADWFRKMASFHRYSPTNTLWILSQRPDSTRVASYRTWQQVGRQVRRGETGIMVFHPKPYWVDATDGRRVKPPATESERSGRRRKMSFGIGHVFDVSQTDGEPLPQLGRPAPNDAPGELAHHLDTYCRNNRIEVETRDLAPGLGGYYQRETDRVTLAAGTSEGERVATLAHELAHREDPSLIEAHDLGDRSYYAHNRPDCEAVAEGAAHTISARFGHDITEHSAGYIASWVNGDVDRFKELHDRVGLVARQLLPPDKLDLALSAAHTKLSIDAAERANPARGR